MAFRLVIVLMTLALGLMLSTVAAVAAAYLARRDHASYPAAINRAGVAFAGTLMLVVAIAGMFMAAT